MKQAFWCARTAKECIKRLKLMGALEGGQYKKPHNCKVCMKLGKKCKKCGGEANA